MTTLTEPDLDDLRRRIDAIDDALQDLIRQRTEVVEAIGRVKRADGGGVPDQVAFRPGREARVLRRLAGRHDGRFAVGTLIRLWREMMAEFTRLQGPFAVAVYGAEGAGGLWDLARDHFGSQTAMTQLASTAQVVAAVNDGAAAIGVLPMPGDDPDGRWWTRLMTEEPRAPRIVAALPFAGSGNARSGDATAVAIARVEPEASDDDRSLIALETEGEASRAFLVGLFGQAGLTSRRLIGLDGADRPLLLAEVEGFVAPDDARLAALAAAAAGRIRRLLVLGAYATPLAARPR